MKRANSYKQNSRDWYSWRGKGLGASDAPAIMGVSPWTSRFELWAQKTGVLPKSEPSVFALQAMERGKRLEPIARAEYEAQSGIPMESDVNCEHPTYSFLRASLDGYSADHNKLLEIKCPGKADHETAVNGEVPEKYMPQLQHQFLVSGATSGDYYSFDGEKGVIVPVFPDKDYQDTLLDQLLEFWKLIEAKVPPRINAQDLTRVVDQISKESEKLSLLFQGLQAISSAFEEQSGFAKPKRRAAKKADADGMVKV